MRTLLLAIAALGFTSVAHAFPSTLRLGYLSCSGCHNSLNGGNMLTAYGHSIADSQSIFTRGNEPKDGPLRLGAQARYLFDMEDDRTDDFLMQLDGFLSARTQIAAKPLRTDLTVGWVPDRVRNQPNPPSGILGKTFVLRKATASVSVTDQDTFVVGRELLPRGISQPNHTSLLRAESRQGVTDMPTQVRWDHENDHWILQNALFAPSFEEDHDNQEFGAISRAEHLVSEGWTLGLDGLYGKTNAIERVQAEVFSRYAPFSTAAVLGVLQWTHRSGRTWSGCDQWIPALTAVVYPVEPVELSYQWERLIRDEPFAEAETRHGPQARVYVVQEFNLMIQHMWETRRGSPTEQFTLIQLLGRI